MAKSTISNKAKILLVLEYVYLNTNHTQGVSFKEMRAYLNEKGLDIDRKVFREYMELFRDEMGWEVVHRTRKVRGAEKEWYWEV